MNGWSEQLGSCLGGLLPRGVERRSCLRVAHGCHVGGEGEEKEEAKQLWQ